ncbi:MAG: hypothetical protein GX080_02360 [Tissierellia bacterium]|nr:hypothetical protein [Tissierellia bacterium]
MNKKLLTIILSFILLTVGCTADMKQNEKTLYESLEKDSYSPDDNSVDKLIKQYKEIAKSDNEPFTLVKFIDDNIKNATEHEAVAMVLILEEVQKDYIQRYTDELFVDNNQQELLNLSPEDLFFNEEKIEDIKNADLKELISKIVDGKYKLINIGGVFYPVVDYEGLKAYADYLPKEINDYLDIKSHSYNKPTVIDGEMVVSHEELGQRLIDIEKYLAKYPNSIKREDALRCYGECLKLYLEGTVNSPIFDVETGRIKEDIMSSYIKLSSTRDLATSNMISKYIEIIQDNQNTIDESVFSHVPEIYSSAIAALENVQ